MESSPVDEPHLKRANGNGTNGSHGVPSVSEGDGKDSFPATNGEINDGAAVLPPLPTIATDFDRAVKNFAQFFNGQIVDMDDDIDALISGNREPSDATAKQPSHPDKDVPF
jgi:hypothetical protein